MSVRTDANDDAGNVSTNETVDDPGFVSTNAGKRQNPFAQEESDYPPRTRKAWAARRADDCRLMENCKSTPEKAALYFNLYEEDEGKPIEGDNDIMINYKKIVDWEEFKGNGATVEDEQATRIMLLEAQVANLREDLNIVMEWVYAQYTGNFERIEAMVEQTEEDYEQTEEGSEQPDSGSSESE